MIHGLVFRTGSLKRALWDQGEGARRQRKELRSVRAILFAGFCVTAFAVHAEPASERYGAEYQTCRDGSTYDIVTCVTKLYKKWDARLNAAYQKLLKQQEDAKSREALVRAQRSWLKYRDDNCGWYETGEGFPQVGAGKSKGLNDFKKSFGGEMYPYYKGNLPIGRLPERIYRAIQAYRQ